MMRIRSAFACAIALATLGFDRTGACDEPSTSLLPNFSFEDWNAQTNAPVAWIYWSQDSDHTISAESLDPSHGSRCLRVYMPRTGMVQVQQYLAVKPHSRYRLTFFMRGGFLGKVTASIEPNLAGLHISTDSRWNFREKWQKHSYEFETKETVNSGIGFRFSGKGVVWLDCVVLEKL